MPPRLPSPFTWPWYLPDELMEPYDQKEQHGFEDDDDGFLTHMGEFQESMTFLSVPSDPIPLDFDPTFAQSPAIPTLPMTTSNENVSSLPDSLYQSAATSEPSHQTKSRGKSSNWSRNTTDILKQWLRSRSDNPYPTKQEKFSLAQETGLTVAQVSTWFANARRRRKRGTHSSLSTSKPVDNLRDSQIIAQQHWSSLSPLDRWENSPPEIEPAPLEAIMNAVAQNGSGDLSEGSFRTTASASGGRRKSLSSASNAQSVVSSGPSGSRLSSSSGSSACTFSSNNSGGSFSCFYLNEPSRRRRRRRHRSKSLRSATTCARPFQCTFCTDTFRTKHDWTRHEKTLHLSLEKFTCAPFGSVYNDPTGGTHRCVFCDEPGPTESHIETHRFSTCQQKPSGFRTFYRKDHLVQHLRLIHKISHITPAVDGWKSQVEHINSRCGFCDKKFAVWAERNDHIAQHFRNGALMKDWRGCRGLDPPVALAVENAMPPYLIGTESKGMNPFSASHFIDTGGEAEGKVRVPRAELQPTPFEYLTARLGEFVQRMSAAGQIVTDEMLQKEARCVVYCDDDPWNQTPADNPEWLKLFKEGTGLGSGSNLFQDECSGNSNGESYNFCLPWSADQWAPFGFNASETTLDLLNINSACTTWSWQSPECLVEFKRHMETLSGGRGGQGEANFECQ